MLDVCAPASADGDDAVGVEVARGQHAREHAKGVAHVALCQCVHDASDFLVPAEERVVDRLQEHPELVLVVPEPHAR